jgi:hypothetical protein
MAATTDDDALDPTDRELRALVLEEAHRQRIEERRRRHELRRQAEESVTLIGVFDALAASGAEVVLQTTSGSHPPAPIAEVGGDYVALHVGGSVRLVPARAIVSACAGGERPRTAVPPARTALRLDLAERLAELASLRQVVHVDAGGRTGVADGRLCQANREVLVVRTADGHDTVVALRTVTAVGLGAGDQSSASPPLSAEPTTSG